MGTRLAAHKSQDLRIGALPAVGREKAPGIVQMRVATEGGSTVSNALYTHRSIG